MHGIERPKNRAVKAPIVHLLVWYVAAMHKFEIDGHGEVPFWLVILGRKKEGRARGAAPMVTRLFHLQAARSSCGDVAHAIRTGENLRQSKGMLSSVFSILLVEAPNTKDEVGPRNIPFPH
jgi:hypothetical protein